MNPETNTPASCNRPRSLRAFAVKIFMLLAVIGLLAAIIIPTVGRTSSCGGRSVASSNLRQIGQSTLIYASDHEDQLPQVDTIQAFAFELARAGGLNDASIWIAGTEPGAASGLSTVLSADQSALEPRFAAIQPGIAAAVRGLKITHPSTTPVAWTRGLQPDGKWAKDSPYDGDGGHIVFLGGNVQWFRDLASAPLARFDGQGTTTDLRAALPPDAVIANN